MSIHVPSVKAPGDALKASDINLLTQGVKTLGTVTGVGVSVAVTPGGVIVKQDKKTIFYREPAIGCPIVYSRDSVKYCRAFQPLQIDGVPGEHNDPLDGEILASRVLTVSEITDETETDAGFVIAATSLAPGEGGIGWVSGVCLARVLAVPLVLQGYGGHYADIGEMGSPFLPHTALTTCPSGAVRILWRPDNRQGTQICVVRFEAPPPLEYEVVEEITIGSDPGYPGLVLKPVKLNGTLKDETIAVYV